jgi:hypothetical protein
MKLSYSGYKTYIQCPKRYLKEVNRVKPPEETSAYFKLYGLLIEKFFKLHSNVYSKDNSNLDNGTIHKILKKLWLGILEKNYVNWTDPWVKESSEHIFESVYQDVLKNLDKFKFWCNANSEVTFDVYLKKSDDHLICRLDYIVTNPDGTVEILDGKGTYKMDKTVDIEQLYFYILMYYLHNKKLPDKAGFLYYKFQTIRYVDFDKDIITDFMKKLSIVKNAAKTDSKYEAKVGISKQCKWCAYKTDCVELISAREALANKRKAKAKVKPDVLDECSNLSIELLNNL